MASPANDDIPTFRIDLARPPELRYVDVAASFGPRIKTLGHVFDELLESMLGSKWLASIAKFAAWLFLRRVHDGEQTREIKGFIDIAGVDLYLVVALNVFLDVMMSCTAGCVQVDTKHGEHQAAGSNLMHFRTLDWGLDPLRDILVILEYVDTSKDPDHVIATSITYAGFVGVLTGIRENLSLSLNYRPIHLCDNWALRKHQCLVILGFRPAISSIIRSTFFSPQHTTCKNAANPSIVDMARSIASIPTAPCYLTFSDGKKAVVVEKDLLSGRIRAADNFIVQTNHDSGHAMGCLPNGVSDDAQPATPHPDLWLADSSERMDVILEKWVDHSGQQDSSGGNRDATSGVWDIGTKPVAEENLRAWMRDDKISNMYTHFACIMDPCTGTIRWVERGPRLQ
ncbi:hypothetical protein QQX98_006160 [Neonectria punicea]|uniref:ceramidase n=1 Tax=Neonectria punicea TaxID=979145 RepID=A0ABR1H251_9HYPO